MNACVFAVKVEKRERTSLMQPAVAQQLEVKLRGDSDTGKMTLENAERVRPSQTKTQVFHCCLLGHNTAQPVPCVCTRASACGQDLGIISTESNSKLVEGGPGLSASSRKPQLYLSDNTDTDTEQSTQCAL